MKQDEIKSHVNVNSFSIGFIVLALAVYILIVAKSLLVPFVVAIGLWYLINALAKGYYSFLKVIPKFFCYILAISTLVFGMWGVVELITANIADVVQEAPRYQKNLEALVLKTTLALKIEDQFTISELLKYINLTDMASSLAKTFTGLAGKTFIVLVYVCFLLYEQRTFDQKISYMISDDNKEKNIRRILKAIDGKIQLYIWVKTLMSALTGGLSYLVMKWVGVDFAEFWGLIIFFLNFIPTIGSLMGIIFPALLTLIQFDTPYEFIVVSAGLSAIQISIGNGLDPKMMGSSLNLSPLVILLSLATWGTIWGIPGMFLSIPIMVIINISLAQFPKTRPIAVMLSKTGAIIDD